MVWAQEALFAYIPFSLDGHVGIQQFIPLQVPCGLPYAHVVPVLPHGKGDVLQLFDECHCPSVPSALGSLMVEVGVLDLGHLCANPTHDGVPCPQFGLGGKGGLVDRWRVGGRGFIRNPLAQEGKDVGLD